MEEESRSMQDRTPSGSFMETMGFMVRIENAGARLFHAYFCSACGRVIARTEVPMEVDGVLSKLRSHRCIQPGKKDFEEEVR